MSELPAGDGIATDAEALRILLRNACMVRKDVDQVAVDYMTAAVNVAWNQEVYDDGGWHDNVTNNSRLTVPSGVSRVRVGGTIVASASTASIMMSLGITKGSSASFDGRAGHAVTNSPNSLTRASVSTGPIPVVAGDYFELQFQVTTDNSINITAGQSNFWIEAC